MVNIYIESSLKDLKRQSGVVCLILENPENKSNTATQFGKIVDSTKYRAELISLKIALGMVKNTQELTIYTDCQYMAAAFQRNWINTWIRNGWKTAKGRDVVDQEEWKRILELLKNRKITFKVNENHEYKLWMKSEVQKRSEKYKKST